MKASGIVRKVDELGRLVIPKEIRSAYDLNEGSPVEIYTDNNNIILTKYHPSTVCIFCNEAEGVTQFKGKNVCPECRKELAG